MTVANSAPAETTLEAGGHVKGVVVAIVSENKDSSGLGRVKVNFPWFDASGESYWARVATPMGGKNRGIYFLPEVGDEVLVAFERGDLRFPYVVGSLWNGADKSPASNDDGNNDVRLVHTRKGHKLTFNDGTNGLVQIELNDGKKIAIDDNGITIDDANGNTITLQSTGGSISLQAATSLSIKAPQISIEATGAATVKAGGTLTLQGAVVSIN
jgi:uncharacterized protein involved in type VI secretion and phage assembly